MIATRQLAQESLKIVSEQKDNVVKDIAKYIAISGGITSLTIATICFHPKEYLEFTNNIAEEARTFPNYFPKEFNQETQKTIPASLDKK